MMNTTNDSATSRQHQPVDVQILAPGEFSGVTISPSDLHEVAANFAKLKGKHDVPVGIRLGHSDEQALAQEDGQPAFGWAEKLYTKGTGADTRLFAQLVGIPKALRDAINGPTRAYRKISASIYPRWERTEAEKNLKSGITGRVLQHVAFLGLDSPRIRSLPDLPRILAAADNADTLLHCESDPPVLQASERPMTLRERLDAVEVKINAMNARNRTATETLKRMSETPISFSSFVPVEAADVQPLGCVFADAVSARIMRDGGSQDDPKARQQAAVAVLKEWKSLPPSPNADDAPSRADQVSQEDFRRVVAGAMSGSGGANYGPSISNPGGVHKTTTTSAPPTVSKTTRVPIPVYGFRATVPTRMSDTQLRFAESMNDELRRIDILSPTRRAEAARRAVAFGKAPRDYGWRS